MNAPDIEDRRKRQKNQRPEYPAKQRCCQPHGSDQQCRPSRDQFPRSEEILNCHAPVFAARIVRFPLDCERRIWSTIEVERISEIPAIVRQPEHRSGSGNRTEDQDGGPALESPPAISANQNVNRGERKKEPSFISCQCPGECGQPRTDERSPALGLPESNREVKQAEESREENRFGHRNGSEVEHVRV